MAKDSARARNHLHADSIEVCQTRIEFRRAVMAVEASTGGAAKESIVEEAAAFNCPISWFTTAHTIA